MIQIEHANKIVKATVPLTPSKSITNRALIIQALSGTKFRIRNAALATDSVILGKILENIPAQIDVHDAGTAFRFLTAYLSIQNGSYMLTGSSRMKNRPVGALVNALRELGADITYLENENFPPLNIIGKKLSGGRVQIDGSDSSQFISALMLIGPELTDGLEIETTGEKRSRPYVDMTLSLMKHFGIQAGLKGDFIRIPGGGYISKEIVIENDWSSASFWYEVAALADEAEIILKGLAINSIQGDVVIDEIMKSFGVQSEISGTDVILRKQKRTKIPKSFICNFSSCPDLVMPVAFTCAALGVPSEFTGVKNLRIKESDRLTALKEELEKTGVRVSIKEDSFLIHPASLNRRKEIFYSHNDHRLAMSIAPLALQSDQLKLEDHMTVSKSYPEFWNQMQDAGFRYKIT